MERPDGRPSMVAGGAPGEHRSIDNTPSGVQMSTAVPATFLVILGALLAVLGLFAAGNLAVVVIGLLAIFGAGLLTLAEARR
jgi:hypothetical protein